MGVLSSLSGAGGQSLCDDFSVPAAHLGNVESCVFDPAGTTTVNLNAPAILHWDRGFRIDPGQRLRFQFNNADIGSAVLNRDLGGGDSIIRGGLSSNGRVMLLNPGNLISIQNGAAIDADGGFLASTLEVSDEEALLRGDPVEFRGSGGAGSAIDNRGTIHSSGGDVILISGSVNNFRDGEVTAPSGSVRIAAGTRVFFGDDIEVLDGDGSNIVSNLGSIRARNVVGIAAHSRPNEDGTSPIVIDNSGSITTTAGIDGRVFLRAAGDGQVLNSDLGSIETGLVEVNANAFVSTGEVLELDDGSNPAAPSGSRQFPNLASGTLSSAPTDDFRLSRLSFSHLNGLESKSKKPTVKTSARPSSKVAVRGASSTTRKPKPAPKKILLRRGSFFGKKTS
jgi:filamentous hemagglutinin family protein